MRDAVFTVTEFIEALNITLDDFTGVVVQGEVDEFKIIHNKWVTFRLKDEHSSIGCFLSVWQYRTQVEDGMLVRVSGKPTLRAKGFFSFVVTEIVPAGEGALKRAFELLRRKLTSEGLFAPERKRALPRFPQHVALITSRDAAAFTDFLKILRGRQGGLTISFIHTLVQGADAPREIVRALERANTELEYVDALVLARGGGSLEDLQAFNDELVVRAVAASRTPTIVGVGHERDVTLAELAADVRASTPSNAAELLVRSRDELRLEITQLKARVHKCFSSSIRSHQLQVRDHVAALKTRVTTTKDTVQRQITLLLGIRRRFLQDVVNHRRRVSALAYLGQQRVHSRFKDSLRHFQQLARMLSSLSPQRTLDRGYSITRTSRGVLLKDATTVVVGDILTTKLRQGEVASTVTHHYS